MDKAPKSGIPYVTDGTTKYWCMTVFQQAAEQERADSGTSSAPELDLARAVQAGKPQNAATGALESAAMVGLTPREGISQQLAFKIYCNDIFVYYILYNINYIKIPPHYFTTIR